jgi:hypothetical protein
MVHCYIVVFDGNKVQYMIPIHNRMHFVKIKNWNQFQPTPRNKERAVLLVAELLTSAYRISRIRRQTSPACVIAEEERIRIH